MLAVIPFGVGLAPVNLPSGLLYLVAVSSISSLGVFLAGWSSRNKYSLLGAMRAVAQLVSYEIPQVLATVPVVLWAGSLSLVTIFDKQLEYGWFVFSPPGLLGVRPADDRQHRRGQPDAVRPARGRVGDHRRLPHRVFGDAVRALLPGRVPERLRRQLPGDGRCSWGAGRRSRSATSRRGSSATATTLSFVLTNAIMVGTFFVKVTLMIFLMFWIRVTIPRMRVDRMMNFAWKYMVPLSLINILAAAVWFECVIRPRPFFAGMIGTRPAILGWQLPVNSLIGWILTLLILVPSAWLVLAINRQARADSLEVTTTLRSPRVPAAAR